MTINKRVLSEDAAAGAVSAGGVAIAPMPLLSSMVKRPTTSNVAAPKPKKKAKKPKVLSSIFASIQEASDPTDSSLSGMDEAGVISKLKGLSNREKVRGLNTVTYGLEDDDGNITRIVLQSDDAQRFEQALQQMLSPAENEDRDVATEIPEILFKLKDEFNIVDVQWPEFREDEEETQVASPDAPQTDAGTTDSPDGQAPTDGDIMGGEIDGQQSTGDATDDQAGGLLTSIIAMMRTDAEARKAEAEARMAEAKQKEAKTSIEQAMAKVKQQEELMDMDAYDKSQREEQSEIKKLAQLARWRRMVQDGESEDQDLSTYVSDEDEEQLRSNRLRNRIDPKELAKYIAKRVR